MKKILLSMFLLSLTATSVMAFTMPRWSYFPVKVYVPEHEKAPIIKEALAEWQSKSGGILSFKYSRSKVSSNLVFEIKDSCSTIGSTNIHAATTYLFKVDVTMCSSVYGNDISDENFKSAALHEVANAIGLKSTEDENNITASTFYDVAIYPLELTAEDLATFNRTYKETTIRENITKKKK